MATLTEYFLKKNQILKCIYNFSACARIVAFMNATMSYCMHSTARLAPTIQDELIAGNTISQYVPIAFTTQLSVSLLYRHSPAVSQSTE